jgi:chromosome partitioning protein
MEKGQGTTHMRTIAIANQKGGTGKTPTTANLAFALNLKGYRVLLVDFDPQGSLSAYFMGFEEAERQDITIYNAIMNVKPINAIHIQEGMDLLNAHDELEAATLELPAKPNAERRLLKVLSFYTNYDFCLIDCPPNLGLLTRNALAAANKVIIPVKTEIAAYRTLNRILGLIEEVKESDLNEDLTIWGILPTLYVSSKAHHNEVLQAIKDMYPNLVYAEPSKDRTAYNDATTAKAFVGNFDKTLADYWLTLAGTLTPERSVI